jgi:hypothetical protein
MSARRNAALLFVEVSLVNDAVGLELRTLKLTGGFHLYLSADAQGAV